MSPDYISNFYFKDGCLYVTVENHNGYKQTFSVKPWELSHKKLPEEISENTLEEILFKK